MRLKDEDRRGRQCQWFDLQEDPRDDETTLCGAPAMHRVKVIGGVTSALVYLCEDHKTHVNEQMAARRVAQQQAQQPRKATG